MSHSDIIEGIDNRLTEIREEIARLEEARTHLIGDGRTQKRQRAAKADEKIARELEGNTALKERKPAKRETAKRERKPAAKQNKRTAKRGETENAKPAAKNGNGARKGQRRAQIVAMVKKNVAAKDIAEQLGTHVNYVYTVKRAMA